MAVCAKCNKVISPKNAFAQCEICNETFHGVCVKLCPEDEDYLPSEYEIWCCEICSKEKLKSSSTDVKATRESNSIASSIDFETAIHKAGCGKFNMFIMLIAMPASCSSAFVTGTMSYVVPVAGADLGLTPTTKALLQSAPYAGMITSALLWGVLSDSMGRQKLLCVGFLLDAAMNTLCALIPTLPTVLIFKFLSGAMVCGPYSIFMAYIAEVFLEEKRNIAVLSAGLFSHTGTIIQACLALVLIPTRMPDWLPIKSWQAFILVCGLPALLSGLGCLFTVESPKFLVEKGKPQEALKVCKTIYAINYGKKPDQYPVNKIHIPKESLAKKSSTKAKIFGALIVLKPPYIGRLLLIFALQMCLASSMNVIRLWLPEMLTLMSTASTLATNETLLCPLLQAGQAAQAEGAQVISRSEVYVDMMIVNASCLAGHILFMVLVKYFQKRFVMMGVSVIAATCAFFIPNVDGSMIFIPAAIVVAVLNCGFYATIAMVVEIFPTCVRATSVSLLMMVGRIAILGANFLFANVIYSYCELLFYAVSFFAASILIICIFLSTKPISPPDTAEARTTL